MRHEFQYNVIIVLFPKGIPKSDQTKVNIRVLDFNDNPPKIHNAPAQLQVNETTPVGAVLFTLIASDPDLQKTNNKLTFVGSSENGEMNVDSNTGALSLTKSLNYSIEKR